MNAVSSPTDTTAPKFDLVLRPAGIRQIKELVDNHDDAVHAERRVGMFLAPRMMEADNEKRPKFVPSTLTRTLPLTGAFNTPE